MKRTLYFGLLALLMGLSQAAYAKAEPYIAADFTLHSTGEKTICSSDLRGKYQLIYFGFTHCGDICPTTLMTMRHALDHLGAKAARIQPIFITLDPERDTPEIADAYARRFSPVMLGLSGSAEEIRRTTKGFKVYLKKVAPRADGSDYVIDHSGFIYLIDPEGNYLAHFPHDSTAAELKAALAKRVE